MLERAIRRLRCAYAIVYGFGGIPLLYMGDELALLNDRRYLDEPEHAGDNRWMHRPRMPWGAARGATTRRRSRAGCFGVLRHLGEARRSIPALHAAVESVPVGTSNPAVIAVVRRHAAGDLVQLYNVSEEWQRCDEGPSAPARPGPRRPARRRRAALRGRPARAGAVRRLLAQTARTAAAR